MLLVGKNCTFWGNQACRVLLLSSSDLLCGLALNFLHLILAYFAVIFCSVIFAKNRDIFLKELLSIKAVFLLYLLCESM